MHRVQVGPLSGTEQLDPMRNALRRAGYPEALVIDDGP
jgi:rare lipoprotein A